MVKDCLLLQGDEANLPTLVAMIDGAIEKGANVGLLPFIFACKALAEYRCGHFESAIEAAEMAMRNPTFEGVQGMCYPILAMAHQRLNHPASARDWLQKDALLVQEVWPDGDNLGENWQTWIFSNVLLEEASALVGPVPAGKGATPTNPTTP